MIIVIAMLSIKPGSLQALRAPAAACIAETRKEKGCLAYDLHVSVTAPDTLVFVEKWQTREDLTAHSKKPHLATWRDASAPHTVSRKVEIAHVDKIEEI